VRAIKQRPSGGARRGAADPVLSALLDSDREMMREDKAGAA